VSVPIDRAPIDDLVTEFAAERRCPSVVWGVVREGGLSCHGSTGTVRGRRPDERTVYRIASMTKSFSVAATLLLRDEGVLRLDDPIGDHAPELAHLRSPTADAPAITIRDLIGMSSGLVSDDPWADRHLDLGDDELDDIVADGLVFAGPTGACFEYSNLGYALLGRVVHRATGRRLQEHVTERLLEPLGMGDTTWEQPDHDDWAPPMRRLDDGWIEEAPTPGDGTIAPMGGLWTTVADLARWVGWLADAFPARDDADDALLRRSSRREMQSPQRYAGRRTVRDLQVAVSYGYGTFVLDEPTHGIVVGHSGGRPGYGSNMRWRPGGSIGVVAVSNVTYAPMTELAALIHDLVVEQGGVTNPERVSDPAIAELADELLDVLAVWAGGGLVPHERLERIFADNVADDDAYSRRAERATGHGPIRVSTVRATTGAAMEITGQADDGRSATITFALAPCRPLRIQTYEVRLTDPG
jgi:CubicO group peptidase (beta-lactamase class C family)